MTNPGDSDEWWKQYGGEGVSSESGGHASVPPPPAAPSPYNSNPQYPAQPMTPQAQPFPSYPQPTPTPPPYGQPAGYGAVAPGYQPYGYPQVRSNNGMAVGALISSIVGFFTCGIGAIVGIILGIVALGQIKQRNQDGRGLALAGIWVGAGVLVLNVIWWIVFLVSLAHDTTAS